MSKMIKLLALAAISGAILALPAAASAGEWKLDSASGKFPQSFTLSFGGTTLTTDGSSLKVSCNGLTGSGEYENSTTAKNVRLSLFGCTENLFGSACTTAGQSTGTIETTVMTGHNVIIENLNPPYRGILFTPNAGHFATFTCGGGLVKDVVSGNGVIAQLTIPAFCNSKAISGSLSFASTAAAAGTQKWTQITTAGTKFDLTSSQNGGAAATSSLDSAGSMSFLEEQTFTC
jgi:hypothetical protein